MTLSSARSITASVRPPRAVFVDYPLGHTSGPPGRNDLQKAIVGAALDLLASGSGPGTIVDLKVSWPGGSDWKQELGHGDDRKPREPAPQYQHDADRVAAEALHSTGGCTSCLGID